MNTRRKSGTNGKNQQRKLNIETQANRIARALKQREINRQPLNFADYDLADHPDLQALVMKKLKG